MFYKYCDYIFVIFLHYYTLQPSLSHLKKESVQKPCRFTSFVLVISNEPRIWDLNIYIFSCSQNFYKYNKFPSLSYKDEEKNIKIKIGVYLSLNFFYIYMYTFC